MLPYFCFQPYSLCKGRKKAFKKDVELLKSIYKNVMQLSVAKLLL